MKRKNLCTQIFFIQVQVFPLKVATYSFLFWKKQSWDTIMVLLKFLKFALTFLFLFPQVNSSSNRLCSALDSNKCDQHTRNPGNTSSKATIFIGSWWCGGMTATARLLNGGITRPLGRTGQKEPRSQNCIQSCLTQLLLIWMMVQSVSSTSLLMTRNWKESFTGCRITSRNTWTN